MASGFVVPSIFTAIDRLTAPLRSMSKGVESFAMKAEGHIQRSQKWFNKLTPGLSEAGKQFLSFATAAAIASAIIGGIMFSVNSIVEYEKAMGSLSALTGLAGDEFDKFTAQGRAVALETGKSSIEVLKAFEIIGGANSELLKSADAMGMVTKAAIILSQASGDELAASAESLIGTMNQFSLGADQASRVMNVLAAGAKAGAATIPQLSESMKNVGAVASGANLSVEETVGLLEVLSTKKLIGAEAGTKLRGSLVALQKAGLGYTSGAFKMSDALDDVKDKLAGMGTAMERDAYIQELFGTENLTAGKILLANGKMIKDYTRDVTGTTEATSQSAKNTATFSAMLDKMTNKWVTLITTSNNASAGLSYAKSVIKFLTDNMEILIGVGAGVITFFLLWKAYILASTAVLWVYNVALGVTAAMQGKIFLSKNIVAVAAYKAAIWLATAAQYAWNVAMSMNPIGLIIIAIVALIAVVYLIVKYWNEWGAAVVLFLGPLGMVISLIQSFRRNWDMIKKSFSEGGILAGLAAIGATLLDTVLMPLQQILEAIDKILGTSMADSLKEFRSEIGVNTTTDESGKSLEPINTNYTMQDSQTKDYAKMAQERYAAELTINDPSGRTSLNGDLGPGIKLGTTRPQITKK